MNNFVLGLALINNAQRNLEIVCYFQQVEGLNIELTGLKNLNFRSQYYLRMLPSADDSSVLVCLQQLRFSNFPCGKI